ncbi:MULTISPECIES: GNAT family N-acetyltransferase [unclassified Aminobacter]|jgi:ribosomal protein S18 acetylase RimI-like enzyme|uniref:GNAT family N-acetyltransferase n=1 Tax=unclassified Aminobacter TaxID=2644704 RepID=UPI000463FB30|nr:MULTISPECIES: GNAT family N-acetyltransferase [unclassified Aminobacter]TWG50020.1 ribosomal protein S18 acetylase RimI-like enzyme [Aminobacter sp. J44]TWH35452.1 ribosomal protein S18 acetylase RimI-like enzyme [Aminobacter sp. J15]
MNTLTIDIRKAEPRDAEAVACVHHEAWQNAYAGIIPHRALNSMIGRRGRAWWENAIRRAASVLVVEMGGDIVGYATIGRNRARELPQEGEIYELYLRPEYQGIGLGTRLFNAARERLAAHGLSGLVVWALEENDGALRFYEGAGGRDVAEGVEVFDTKALRKVAFVWN